MNSGMAQNQSMAWSGLAFSSRIQNGIVPSIDTVTHPTTQTQSSLNASLSWRGLNFIVSYSYVQPNSQIGIKNGFSFQLVPPIQAVDSDALLVSLEQKLNSKLDSIDGLRTNYHKRLQYLMLYKGDSITVPKWDLIDTSVFIQVVAPTDTLAQVDTTIASFQPTLLLDPKKSIGVEDEIDRCQMMLNQLDSAKQMYNAQLDRFKRKRGSYCGNPFLLSLPFQIRKFDVGNFTSSNSPISLFGTSLFGISTAFNFDNYYVEGGIGKLQSPIFPEINQYGISKQVLSAFQSWSSNVRSSSRSLAWLVIGRGRPEQSHFYIQGLTGRGKRNIFDDHSSNAINYVLEAQCQWVKGASKINCNVAKSFLSRPVEIFSEAHNSKLKYDVGYAAHLGASHRIERLKSDVDVGFKYFTSSFNSFGLAISRRDFVQSQLSWKQSLGRNLRVVIQAKYDLAGLKVKIYDLKSLTTSLRLKMIKHANFSITGSINKGNVGLAAIQVPVDQSLVSGLLTVPVKCGKLIPVFTAQRIMALNKQQYTTSSIQNTSMNLILSKNSISTRFGFAEIIQKASNSLKQRMAYCEASLSVTKYGWNASLVLKQSVLNKSIYGFGLNGGIVLAGLAVQSTIEKIVYDPIATPWLSSELVSKYPYRGSLQITYTIKKLKS